MIVALKGEPANNVFPEEGAEVAADDEPPPAIAA